MLNSEILRIPAEMLLRDAIFHMNAEFQTSAVIVNPAGDALGILDGESIARGLAMDADALLTTPCIELLEPRRVNLAA
ncbi:hypothetical protein J2T57_003086 [Natronocella acetinitrilica]|uniref:Uncharacterized protein n=1 Tax=Natronocella acetinitrilica TaxID=414046 RepID=A0AAE3G4Z2_9GAMM|nr:hypothetical protein [Natronocella acetinitrilica]MCP1675931.1 hypothetical protein [Natronocella acetinitrilica]